MMAKKTFRSEDEQLSSLLDETQGSFPFLNSQDPVIFHNAEYERELLMAYNLDFGESCSATAGEMEECKPNIEPHWMTSPSESEVSYTPKYRYTPYQSGPLLKHSSPPPKRGRPQKATSNSKMANYARNYREQKKSELSAAQIRISELEAELDLAKEENKRMQETLIEATSEISQLRKVIDQDSQIANVVARMSDRCISPLSLGTSRNAAGVCVHVGSQGTTVEVCKQCADNSQQRMQMKAKLEDIEPTLLFNGDFSSIEHLLDV